LEKGKSGTIVATYDSGIPFENPYVTTIIIHIVPVNTTTIIIITTTTTTIRHDDDAFHVSVVLKFHSFFQIPDKSKRNAVAISNALFT
jgi:hypothetical protein